MSYQNGISSSPPMDGFSDAEKSSYDLNKHKLTKAQWVTWSNFKNPNERNNFLELKLSERDALEKHNAALSKDLGCDGKNRFVFVGQKKQGLDFNDSEIQIIFSIKQVSFSENLLSSANMKEEITFDIKNNLTKPIKLVWDDSSIVDMSGTSTGIFGKNTKFLTSNQAIPPSVIAPNSKLHETLIPKDRVKWAGQSWVIGSLGLFNEKNIYKKAVVGFTLEGTKKKYYQIEIGSCPI
jgi:hypothetical protein